MDPDVLTNIFLFIDTHGGSYIDCSSEHIFICSTFDCDDCIFGPGPDDCPLAIGTAAGRVPLDYLPYFEQYYPEALI